MRALSYMPLCSLLLLRSRRTDDAFNYRVIIPQTNTLNLTFGTQPSGILMIFGTYVVLWVKMTNPKNFGDRIIGLDFTGSWSFGIKAEIAPFQLRVILYKQLYLLI